MGKRGQGTTVNAGGLSRTGQYSGGGPELSKGRPPAVDPVGAKHRPVIYGENKHQCTGITGLFLGRGCPLLLSILSVSIHFFY